MDWYYISYMLRLTLSVLNLSWQRVIHVPEWEEKVHRDGRRWNLTPNLDLTGQNDQTWVLFWLMQWLTAIMILLPHTMGKIKLSLNTCCTIKYWWTLMDCEQIASYQCLISFRESKLNAWLISIVMMIWHNKHTDITIWKTSHVRRGILRFLIFDSAVNMWECEHNH